MIKDINSPQALSYGECEPTVWKTRRFVLGLTRPLIMGIVNATPDSFYDGGRFEGAKLAIEHAAQLLRDGADILDIGGESSRPGALPVDAQQEWDRVEPIIREVLQWGVPVSLDSYRLLTQRRALDLGVDIINDIWAMRQEGAVAGLVRYGSGVCLMHMNGEPRTMQKTPLACAPSDVVSEVGDFLATRAAELESAGYERAQIVLDPGIGFGKTDAQNLYLLKAQRDLTALGYPLLVGWSRKSTLGRVSGLGVKDRLVPSVAALVMALERGARILRVHDVQESKEARAVFNAVQTCDER